MDSTKRRRLTAVAGIVKAGVALTPVTPMRDASALLRDLDWRELRRWLERDGYLLLRGVLPKELVLKARRHVVGVLLKDGVLMPGSDPMDAVCR